MSAHLEVTSHRYRPIRHKIAGASAVGSVVNLECAASLPVGEVDGIGVSCTRRTGSGCTIYVVNACASRANITLDALGADDRPSVDRLPGREGDHQVAVLVYGCVGDAHALGTSCASFTGVALVALDPLRHPNHKQQVPLGRSSFGHGNG